MHSLCFGLHTIYVHEVIHSSLMFLQLPQQTVCMNNDRTDTRSVSTTQLTAVDYVLVPMAQLTVSASLVLLLHVPTLLHRNAAAHVKVQILQFCQVNSKTKQL